ncbi:MAG: ATP-dependent zinc metalloprotease FtsH [Desulfobacterales bacterium]|jgi:cell division protease FtsH|nr:ATP-dependent zinc metalloprotease FtsH [Desulfobacterales bacterium]
MNQRNAKNKFTPPWQRNSFDWKTLLWVLVVWLLFIYMFQGLGGSRASKKISYTQFKHEVLQNKVAEITMRGNEINGTYKQAKGSEKSEKKDKPEKPRRSIFSFLRNKSSKAQHFQTIKPDLRDPELLQLLQKHKVIINAESQKSSTFWTIVFSFLPWILILVVFFYISKKMQERMMGGGRGKGIFGFGQSKAKLFDKKSITVTYDDVAGLDNAKKELQEVVEYLKNPTKFKNLGAELPRGILLVGPPGVGKTLMAQASAGEADVPFYSISGSEFIEMFVGVGASRVRDMFKKAKKDAPTIIFIDELDSIGRARGTGLGGGHDEREQTLNQILAEMDGFSTHEAVVVLAATNRPDVLDPALVRPGRFDRRITVDLPQKEARRKILKIHTRKVPLSDDVDLEILAERTVGLSGADLKNLVNEAALLAGRKNKDIVAAEDFDRARDKILMGIEREDVISDSEKKIIAYHEAGHALMAELLPDADPLQKVSIIPRGRALGATEQIPEEDRYNLKRGYLLSRIAIILGGRTAEKIVFNDVSTGAGDDLKKATQLARRMVCQWGMSEKLGPVTFRMGEQHPFLGRELTEPRDFSEYTARLIDEEVHRIITDMEKKSQETLLDHRGKLDALAEQLLRHETLNKEDVDEILKDSVKSAD